MQTSSTRTSTTKTSVVTGGAGFIGSHLITRLLKRGDKVIVFDDFSTGSQPNLESVNDSITIIKGDVRDSVALQNAITGADTVFHLAAISSVLVSVDQPQPTWEVNLQGTWNALEASRLAGVSRFVFASSASVYGESTALPYKEDIELCGSSPYATSKLLGEQLCAQYQRLYDIETTCLRFFSVYGPRQNPKSQYSAVIPTFATLLLDGKTPLIYGDGSQTRDFISVTDISRAIVLASESDQAIGQTFNIGSGTETSILDLYHRISDILNVTTKPRYETLKPGDDPRTLADSTKAQECLGFETTLDIDSGLRETISWFANFKSVMKTV